MSTSQTIKILAISGSLREASSNSTLLRAAAIVAPESVEIKVYAGMGSLPHFNPDLDDAPIAEVIAYRAELKWADAVIICSPEYAHGVPGSLKNALDWVVGSGELVDKPIALINASPRGTYAQASLRETITVMNANIIDAASVTISLVGKKLDEHGIAADAELSEALRTAITVLIKALLSTDGHG